MIVVVVVVKAVFRHAASFRYLNLTKRFLKNDSYVY